MIPSNKKLGTKVVKKPKKMRKMEVASASDSEDETVSTLFIQKTTFSNFLFVATTETCEKAKTTNSSKLR